MLAIYIFIYWLMMFVLVIKIVISVHMHLWSKENLKIIKLSVICNSLHIYIYVITITFSDFSLKISLFASDEGQNSG